MVKASIFIATHNKMSALANTLYSINRQKTTFPFEVCVVDDASDEWPYTLIVDMLPDIPLKFVRLNQNMGCGKSQIECLSIMAPNSNVIVLQSADVMYAGDDVLEKLVRNLEPMVATMAEVRNVEVPERLWADYDKLGYYLDDQRLHETLDYINKDPKQPERGKYSLLHTVFSGPRQPDPDRRWYFFLGAIRKEDLLKTCFRDSCFDVDLSASLHRVGIKVKYVDAVGIHQKHPVG
jgi:glycosyltransferase involved in cell wall biosynthesis